MIKKVFLIISGSIFVLLGTIGIFLPLLPTTPFLLLAAACYLKSSDRLHNWLLNHRILGKFIRNYVKYRAITIESKVVTISLLWLAIGYSIFFVVSIFYLRMVLMLIAIGVSIHLLSMNTLRDV